MRRSFIKKLGRKLDDAPTIEEVEDFWQDIWSEEKGFKEEVERMKHTEEINEKKQHLEENKISKDEIEFAKINQINGKSLSWTKYLTSR